MPDIPNVVGLCAPDDPSRLSAIGACTRGCRAVDGELRIIANEREYQEKEAEQRDVRNLPEGLPIVFLEVTLTDASQFESELDVTGEVRHGYQILKVASPSVANAIAALSLKIRDDWDVMPHIYFAWAEGQPVPTSCSAT